MLWQVGIRWVLTYEKASGLSDVKELQSRLFKRKANLGSLFCPSCGTGVQGSVLSTSGICNGKFKQTIDY